jgi:hypothetical protein
MRVVLFRPHKARGHQGARALVTPQASLCAAFAQRPAPAAQKLAGLQVIHGPAVNDFRLTGNDLQLHPFRPASLSLRHDATLADPDALICFPLLGLPHSFLPAHNIASKKIPAAGYPIRHAQCLGASTAAVNKSDVNTRTFANSLEVANSPKNSPAGGSRRLRSAPGIGSLDITQEPRRARPQGLARADEGRTERAV